RLPRRGGCRKHGNELKAALSAQGERLTPRQRACRHVLAANETERARHVTVSRPLVHPIVAASTSTSAGPCTRRRSADRAVLPARRAAGPRSSHARGTVRWCRPAAGRALLLRCR